MHPEQPIKLTTYVKYEYQFRFKPPSWKISCPPRMHSARTTLWIRKWNFSCSSILFSLNLGNWINNFEIFPNFDATKLWRIEELNEFWRKSLIYIKTFSNKSIQSQQIDFMLWLHGLSWHSLGFSSRWIATYHINEKQGHVFRIIHLVNLTEYEERTFQRYTHYSQTTYFSDLYNSPIFTRVILFVETI